MNLLLYIDVQMLSENGALHFLSLNHMQEHLYIHKSTEQAFE
nr:MAG TPA: hypothetical protein [Caudoviricetes sp.]